MAQSQCRQSIGDKFWAGVVVENKESLYNRSSNPNKSGAVTLSEIFLKDFDQVLSKNRGLSRRWSPIASEAIGDDICERLFFKLKGVFFNLSQPPAASQSVLNV